MLWAAGLQVRQLESRTDINDPFLTQQCDWPLNFTSQNGAGSSTLPALPAAPTDPTFRGCTPDGPGAFVYNAPVYSSYNDQQQTSFFGELQVPVLSNLNFQLAARREDFSGGLGATVYKVSGKWDVWGPLSIRGSYGTNFQAPGIGLIPGRVTNGNTNYTINGLWLGSQTVTDSGIVPETAKSWNTGVIWQSQGFASDHKLRLIVDYFNIETENEIGALATFNQIANLIFNGTGGTITTCDPAVQPLLNRIVFNAGCTVGMNSVGTFSTIRTSQGNGPGQTTNGIDYQFSYEMPIGPGDLSLGVTATQVTKLFTGPTKLDGILISTGDDRLGTLNYTSTAAAAPEWRANFSANYSWGKQNFRLGYNFVSAVTDERPGIQYGENGRNSGTWDFTYLLDLTEDLRLTATVNNIGDQAPPPAQSELGYDPRIANPLGRTFELSVKKTF